MPAQAKRSQEAIKRSMQEATQRRAMDTDLLARILRPSTDTSDCKRVTDSAVKAAIRAAETEWPGVADALPTISKVIQEKGSLEDKHFLILLSMDRLPKFRESIRSECDPVRFNRFSRYLGAYVAAYLSGMPLYIYNRKPRVVRKPAFPSHLDFTLACSLMYASGGKVRLDEAVAATMGDGDAEEETDEKQY